MRPPSFVSRALARLAAAGVVALLAVWLGGIAIERIRLGGDETAARAKVQAAVSEQVAALESRLEQTINAVGPAIELVQRAEIGDATAQRLLFERIAAATPPGPPVVSMTVYGESGVPIAWTGRPTDVPGGRIDGPDATFLAPGPQGLRLVRICPLEDSDLDRRVGTLVLETLVTAGGATDAGGYVLSTRLLDVAVRPRFEGGSDSGGDEFVIQSADGNPLAAVSVPSEALAAARAMFRARAWSVFFAVAAGVLLLATGPLLDWRRVARAWVTGIVTTLAVAVLIVLARMLVSTAIRNAGLDGPPLLEQPRAAQAFFRSPLDFLASSLFAGAMAGLAASTLDLWRVARRGFGAISVDTPGRTATFVAGHVAAGAAVTALVIGYEAFLRFGVAAVPADILHFGLRPWDWQRLAVVTGLVVLNAAVAVIGIVLLRLARAPWAVGSVRSLRVAMIAAWLAAPVVVTASGLATNRAPSLPTLLALTFIAAVAWRIGWMRTLLRHSSQAMRLLAAVAILVLPSLAFYPSIVDASNRARHTLVETRFAPEVLDQRRNLQTQLDEALASIDRLEGLDDLVRAADPPAQGAPPTDAAFLVWSQTPLAAQRLTSSVELYNGTGALVSRFALKLPDLAGALPATDTQCNWDVFEEVSPFFAEERRLLHAGRSLCATGPGGRVQRLGSVVVHVMLDYGNLSFVSAQSPYVALLRSGRAETAPPGRRGPVDFTVYGWSRQVLFTSEPTGWPLDDETFARAAASREPFWTNLSRDGRSAEGYVFNDRGAIYVLSAWKETPFGHLVVIAELVTLAFLTFLAGVIGGMLYGAFVVRTPTSGRALLREVRASFYRKLFLAFVAATVVPVVALAFVTRAYFANLMFADIEMEATRTAGVASRVVEDFASLQARGLAALPLIDDNVVVWLSRVIAQDVNIFAGPDLLASSERNLFASGLLPTRTPGDAYRAIMLEGRPSFVGRESAGGVAYLVAAAPVRVEDRDAILMVPLTSRQQEIEGQVVELDRRVLLAALLFIMLGAGIGYSMAERIADPVNRLMRATRRIARGDLDARVIATSSDELQRLVEAFNTMAEDLRRQRAELERTNRLAAWAEMARQVAHDIKNPLTPIQLNAEHLQRVHNDRARPLGTLVDECVAKILGQVRLLRQISSEFSSFASSPRPSRQAVDLESLVRGIVDPYRAALAGRVEFYVEMPPGLPNVYVDPLLIGRALTNVIENALHAMSGTGTLRLTADNDPEGRQVILRIADSGIGMDQDALARIFEPYFSTKTTGTGLGLTIAKRNVEANGGTVSVVSTPGIGTTVSLALPAVGLP
jgi:signal transduction histidine kinase